MNRTGPNRDAELQGEIDALRARLCALESRLHRSHRHGRAPGSEVEVLLVDIDRLGAAFELERVKEVVPAARLAPLPEAPPWILGTLNLRGATIPVLDLGARLARTEPELDVADVIVIVATELGSAGIVVDDVGAVCRVQLDTEVSLLEARHAAYVAGTFSHQAKTRLLLGVKELLRDSEVSANAPAEEATP